MIQPGNRVEFREDSWHYVVGCRAGVCVRVESRRAFLERFDGPMDSQTLAAHDAIMLPGDSMDDQLPVISVDATVGLPVPFEMMASDSQIVAQN